MAKRINKNMVAALTAFGFVVMTAAGVLMILQLRDVDPANFVALAEQQADNGKWVEASLYYKKAYDVSQDEKYLVDMGQMLYDSGDEPKAAEIWRNALTNNPELLPAKEKILDYRYEVVKLAAGPGRWRELLVAAEAVLEHRDQDAFALFCQGRAMIGLRHQDPDYEEAGFEAMERAVEIAPDDVEYSLTLAMAAESTGRAERADDLITRLTKANTTPGRDAFRIRAWHARELSSKARAAAAKGDEVEAEELHQQARSQFDEAIALAGEDPVDQAEARLFLAQTLFRWKVAPVFGDPLGDRESVADIVEEVKTLLEEAIERDPDGFLQYKVYAELLRGLKRPMEAIAVLEQRGNRDIDRKGLKGTERKRGRYSLLIEATDECLRAAGNPELSSEEREAVLDKAQQFVLDARGEFPGMARATHMEGRVLLARGKDLEALTKFEEADHIFQSTDVENKTYLATLYLLQGQLGAAQRAIELAVKHPGAGPAVWRTYTRVLRLANKPSPAAEAAQRALALKPGDRETLLLLADCFNDMERPDLVKTTLDQLEGGAGANTKLQAQAFIAGGKYEEALALMTPLLETDPANRSLADTVFSLYRALEQHEQAKAVLERALAENPDSLYFRRVLLGMKTDLTEEERDERLLALINGLPDEYLRAMNLADYYNNREVWDEAVVALATAARLVEEGATPLAIKATKQRGDAIFRELVDRRFVILLMQQRWAEAEELAAQAAERNLDAVGGLTFHGRVALMRDEAERAAELFRQALELRPNSSEVLVLLGQAYLDLDRSELARDTFKAAVEVNPASGQAHKGLAALAKTRQDGEAYRTHISECFRLLPDDEWVTAEREGLQTLADPEGAIKRLLAELEENPEDVKTLLQLGLLYGTNKHIEEARQTYEKALELAPDDLGVVNRVAMFYRIRLPETGRSLEILQTALKAMTDPEKQSAAHFLLAQYYIATEERELADAAYLAAADKHDSLQMCLAVGRYFFTTGRPAMAYDWLDKAAAKAKEANDPGLQSIGNMRAESLIAMGDYERATEEVEQLLADYPLEGNTALLFRADIEAARGEIDNAVKSLTQYLESGASKPLALFRRARYQSLQGKWSLAIKDLELLKAQDPDALEQRPRKWLALAYQRAGRADMARGELETLLEEHPDDAGLAEQLITLHLSRGDFERAERVARRMANLPEARAFWTYRRGQITAQQARAEQEATAKRKYVTRTLQELRRASELSEYDPRVVGAYLMACREFEDFDTGIQFYDRSLTPEQRTAALTASYAGLLAGKGLTSKALEQYRVATDRLVGEPNWALPFRGIVGDALRAFGEERAVELFRPASADQQLTRTDRTLAAAVLSAGGQHSEGASLFQQLLQSPQDDLEEGGLLLLLGTAADQAQDFQTAKQCYEKTIKLEPLNWVAYNNLAFLLCEKLNQCSEALPYAERAAELANQPSVEDTLAAVFIGLGQHQRAVGVLANVLLREPGFLPGYLHLAEAYRRLGRFQMAQDQLAEAQKLIDAGGAEQHAEAVTKIERMREQIANQDSSP